MGVDSTGESKGNEVPSVEPGLLGLGSSVWGSTLRWKDSDRRKASWGQKAVCGARVPARHAEGNVPGGRTTPEAGEVGASADATWAISRTSLP
jgi:hypothetical protein